MMATMEREGRVLTVVGARPNFMKTVPVIAALKRRTDTVRHTLVHTGQHYDDAMSQIFFEELGVGAPDEMLSVGSASHAVQTARVMERLEPVIERIKPDLILVPGDVNSTLAAALVASKLGRPRGPHRGGPALVRSDHARGGQSGPDRPDLRPALHPFSRSTREPRAGGGGARAGAPGRQHDDRHARGDAVADCRGGRRRSATAWTRGSYLVVTLHRPALVDGPLLAGAVAALDEIAAEMPVMFPIHPRTAASMERQGLAFASPGMRILDPLGYVEFLSLVQESAGVLTDSGGMQEETTYLGIPCFTLRDNTERPITCDLGTNVLLGLAPEPHPGGTGHDRPRPGARQEAPTRVGRRGRRPVGRCPAPDRLRP